MRAIAVGACFPHRDSCCLLPFQIATMDMITGAAAWSEWAASNWKAVTAVLGLLYALPGKWEFLVGQDLQFRAIFGYSMACEC